LSISFAGILPLVAAEAKKQTFIGALDLQMDLAPKSQHFHLYGTKTPDSMKPLRVQLPHNVITALWQNLLPSK